MPKPTVFSLIGTIGGGKPYGVGMSDKTGEVKKCTAAWVFGVLMYPWVVRYRCIPAARRSIQNIKACTTSHAWPSRLQIWRRLSAADNPSPSGVWVRSTRERKASSGLMPTAGRKVRTRVLGFGWRMPMFIPILDFIFPIDSNRLQLRGRINDNGIIRPFKHR